MRMIMAGSSRAHVFFVSVGFVSVLRGLKKIFFVGIHTFVEVYITIAKVVCQLPDTAPEIRIDSHSFRS